MQTEIKTIDNQRYLVVTIPLTEPQRSKSGQTLIVANSCGPAKSNVLINNKPVTVNLSAWIKP